MFPHGLAFSSVVKKLNHDIEEILKNKEIIEKFNAQGADPFITQPNEFANILRKDIIKWREVVKASGAQID